MESDPCGGVASDEHADTLKRNGDSEYADQSCEAWVAATAE